MQEGNTYEIHLRNVSTILDVDRNTYLSDHTRQLQLGNACNRVCTRVCRRAPYKRFREVAAEQTPPAQERVPPSGFSWSRRPPSRPAPRKRAPQMPGVSERRDVSARLRRRGVVHIRIRIHPRVIELSRELYRLMDDCILIRAKQRNLVIFRFELRELSESSLGFIFSKYFNFRVSLPPSRFLRETQSTRVLNSYNQIFLPFYMYNMLHIGKNQTKLIFRRIELFREIIHMNQEQNFNCKMRVKKIFSNNRMKKRANWQKCER